MFSFVRFILFIPSKCPEQLTVSGKSGTLALFTLTSKSDDTRESEAEGLDLSSRVQVQIAGMMFGF